MTRMITLILLLAGGVHAQTQTQTDWRFAHPNADIRASINVQTFLKSPMIAALKDQAPKESQAQIGMGLAMLSTIDRVSFSMNAPPPLPPGADGAASQPDALVLISGVFDAQLLKLMLGAGGPEARQVDPHTVLVGQGASFTQAIARLAASAPAASAGELEASDLFIDGDIARLSQQQGTPTPPPFQNVRRFALGMNVGDNVDFSLILTAAAPSDVELLMKTFHDLMGQAGTTPEMAAMVAKALDMRADGAKLRVHFVPPPEMIKAAQQQAAGGDPSGALSSLQPLLNMLGMGAGSPAAPAKSTEPPPSNGGRIVINGLDDGPRVITPAR